MPAPLNFSSENRSAGLTGVCVCLRASAFPVKFENYFTGVVYEHAEGGIPPGRLINLTFSFFVFRIHPTSSI